MTGREKSFRTGIWESRVISPESLSADEMSAWKAFCRNNPDLTSPFYTPPYARAAAQAQGRVYVCVLKRHGQIAGFLPFQFRGALQEWLGYADRVGEEMTDYFGLIAEPSLRIQVRDLLRLAGLNYLYFTHLDESQLVHGLPAERPEVGLRLQLVPQIDYWSQQMRERSRKLVSETERLERAVQREHGPLRFCMTEAEWQEPLRHLMARKGEQYARTGRPNMFAEGWRVRLLENLASINEAGCRGSLSTLYAGDTWVASHFGLRGGSVLHYWFPVYNPDLKRYAPGRLLLKQVIQSAPAAGIECVDRGAGDNYTKRLFTNQEHRFYRGVWYRHGIRSTAVRLHQSLKWRFHQPAKTASDAGLE
jgi:CelD/BcsL family acetyltransferase involved in cellulose biosynthesis